MPAYPEDDRERWLLLIHQLPARPLYLRAQVRRRLMQVGAVALKHSVYVLPDQPECLEDFQWIAQEALAAGGDACICRTAFLHGVPPGSLERRFQEDAAARFEPVKVALARQLADLRRVGRVTGGAAGALTRLRRQVAEGQRTDFFGADAGREVWTLMRAIDETLAQRTKRATRQATGARRPGDLVGRVWVTRRDPHIDRLATAWLIRRFVDPEAKFRFLDSTGAPVAPAEKSFDMIGADFTHEGDRCSFETMVGRLGLTGAGFKAIAEVVHDIDLKDGKFGRPEGVGIQQIVEGLSKAHPDSMARITAALPVFDALFASFGGTAGPAGRQPRKATSTRRRRR